MISKIINDTAKDIKDLKIQGASKIELSAINAILEYIKSSNLEKDKFIGELIENINYLIKQRPNEPKLRNSLNFVLKKSYRHNSNLERQKLINEISAYEEYTEKCNKKVSEIASKLITNDMNILTHCHSNLVEDALKAAYDNGIKFKVYNTETRPKYQGRITSKNLCDYGIDTTQIVDSAVTHVLKKCDIFLSGADVVFSDGAIMNKVGTYGISILAKAFKTEHIVITTTHCCELDLLLNVNEPVEQRDDDEVWAENERPKNLKILNPSFDIIPEEYISRFITEEGVFSAEGLSLWVNKVKSKYF
ncbi:MAG: S-methyl-5-thioribose-1-phosphate isomerase [archaeon]